MSTDPFNLIYKAHNVDEKLTESEAKFCAVGSKRRNFSAPECVLAAQVRSVSSEVDNFGTNQKRVCDFLLVINSNFGPILHRF